MSPVSMLSNLSQPTSAFGAPFGLDVLQLIEALDARGSTGLYVARDDKQAATALKLATLSGVQALQLPTQSAFGVVEKARLTVKSRRRGWSIFAFASS